jgi:sarcosine oxidase
MDRVPGHESVVVGLGAAHGFKFAPTFSLRRPALTEPDYEPHW